MMLRLDRALPSAICGLRARLPSLSRTLATHSDDVPTQRHRKQRQHTPDGTTAARSFKRRPSYLDDPYLLSTKLNKLLEARRLDEAIELVQSAPQHAQSPVVWNELIRECASARYGNRAWKVYNMMKKSGFTPTAHTYTSLLNAYARAQPPSVARAEALVRHITQETSTAATFAALCGRLSQTHLNAFIKVYAAADDANQLGQVLEALRSRHLLDSVSCATLISAYGRMGLPDKAWEIWQKDVMRGQLPVDGVLLGALLQAFARTKDKTWCKRAYMLAERTLQLGTESRSLEVADVADTPEHSLLLRPTPANMDQLMLCCARAHSPVRGYRYFVRALDRYWKQDEYQPDLQNFLSATGLIVSALRQQVRMTELRIAENAKSTTVGTDTNIAVPRAPTSNKPIYRKVSNVPQRGGKR